MKSGICYFAAEFVDHRSNKWKICFKTSPPDLFPTGLARKVIRLCNGFKINATILFILFYISLFFRKGSPVFEMCWFNMGIAKCLNSLRPSAPSVKQANVEKKWTKPPWQPLTSPPTGNGHRNNTFQTGASLSEQRASYFKYISSFGT